MAKRKGYRKSSKCPEPFNTLIDIAGGIAMGAIASHMEKKYRYSSKGKINPYAVSALGIASGRMRSTEDILRTGAFLGAMGSFDVEADRSSIGRHYVPDDPILSRIKETKVNNNRYAWRMNCEDGSTYGVYPNDFETREEYNQALSHAKNEQEIEKEQEEKKEQQTKQKTEWESPFRNSPFLCCRVSRLDNGANEFFLTEDEGIKVGDIITVQTDSGVTQGVVIGVKRLSKMSKEELPDESMWIISQENEEDGREV